MIRDTTLIHPRLMAARAHNDRWDEQRKQCDSCAHLMRGANGWMKCGATVAYGPRGKANCIDALDGACGPDAKLWVAAP